MDWRKALKIGVATTLVGFGTFRLTQREYRWNTRDPLGWMLLGIGTASLLQEAARVTEEAWDKKQDEKIRAESRYYPVL